MQTADPGNLKILRKAYETGAVIAGGTDESVLGKEYADDLLEFIVRSLGKKFLTGCRVLDIGCGIGYLLHRLQMLGAVGIGIEPGGYGQIGVEQYGVQIIRDYFPSTRINGQYDLIFMHMVLEHMENPFQTLEDVKNLLSPSGHLVISVEDEEGYIEYGDMSILFHEHFSYFTEHTLARTLRCSGFKPISIIKANFSRILYAYASHSHETMKTDVGYTNSEDSQRIIDVYKERCESAASAFNEYFKQVERRHETVGIYVPARAINMLSRLKIIPSQLRFFDDDPSLYKSYFPGYAIGIENRSDLIDKPPDHLFVMSSSFGKRIKADLPEEVLLSTRVVCWEEMFDGKTGVQYH